MLNINLKKAFLFLALRVSARRCASLLHTSAVSLPSIPDKIAVCLSAQHRHLAEGILCTQRPLVLLLPSPYSCY
jgi:hypothetical protein